MSSTIIQTHPSDDRRMVVAELLLQAHRLGYHLITGATLEQRIAAANQRPLANMGRDDE